MGKGESKELQGKHYDELGLSRGVISTLSGDDEKIAHSILEDAKNKNLDVKIKKNDLDEYEVYKDNIKAGVINKKGMSRQDALNVLRDPTNLLMLVPGLNVLGGMAKTASLGSKVMGSLKGASKLFGLETAANLGLKASANIEGNNTKDGIITGEDVNNSLISGAIAPIASVVGEGAVKGISKILPKKTTKMVNEEDDILLTPAQKSKSSRDLAYEEDLRRGLKGEKSKEIIEDFLARQKQSILDNYNKKYGVEFLDIDNSNRKAGKILDDILYNKNAMQKEIEAGYSDLKPKYGDFGYNQEQLASFVDYLKGNLIKERNKPWNEITAEVKALGRDHPLNESYNSINKIEEFLLDSPKNITEIKNLDDLLKAKSGEIENFAKSRDGTNIALEYGNKKGGARHINEKHWDVFNENNDIVKKLADIELNKEKTIRDTYEAELGDNLKAYLRDKDNGGMKISTIFKNVDKKNRGLDLPIGPTSNQTRELPKEGVSNDQFRSSQERSSILDSLTKNGENVKEKLLAPEEFDIKNYPNSEGFRSYNDFEVARQMLNKKLSDLEAKGKAKTPEFRMLSILKNSFNEFENSALNKQKLQNGLIEPKMMGSKENLEELKRLREINADYNKKFENSNILNELETGDLRSYGADFLKKVVDSPEKAAEDIVKMFEGVDSAKQVGVINKIREIFGDKYDKDLKQIYLNSIFTDRHKVGGTGNFNVLEANKKLNDRILKNNKVAKMLFSENELGSLKKESEVLEGLSKSRLFSQNPSGTSFNLIKNGLLDSSSLFSLIKKYSVDKILETKEANKLKQYLGGYMENEDILPNENIVNGIRGLIYGGINGGVND